jgi:2,3-bisphosphoglycerate-dependent phosphoglycerate mutase
MNRIYLVRHGENTANLTKEFSHRLIDYSLTPKGILQAQQTAEFFKDKHIDAIYTSPLKRSFETAAIIGLALGLEPVVAEEFREVNVGQMETWPPSAESWAEHDRIVRAWFSGQPELAFPEGEDYHGLVRRMRAGLDLALSGRDDANVVIVGHGGIFTFTIADICADADLGVLIHAPSHNCSITEIQLGRVNGRLEGALRSWAASGHLSGDAAVFVAGHPAYERSEMGQ